VSKLRVFPSCIEVIRIELEVWKKGWGRDADKLSTKGGRSAKLIN